MSDNSKESSEKLLQLVNAAIEEEKALREKYQIGDKFRFIREKLAALQVKIADELQEIATLAAAGPDALAPDEMLVYIYIFNSQGLAATTWQKMLHHSVYYEYSVNRPIYTSQEHADAILRSKINKAQHGYLTVAIKKEHLLAETKDSPTIKDINDNPQVKIKEGSLRFDRVISFTYNENVYSVKENGEMVKKSP